MTFEIINNEQGHMSLKGYRFVIDAERFWDKEIYEELASDIGVNYVDALFDDFYEGFEPICMGDNGKFYSVLFRYDFGTGEFKPFIWQEVEKVK